MAMIPPFESVLAAIQYKYSTISAVPFPGGVRPYIYMDEATAAGQVTGTKLDPPYVVITDGGEAPTPPPGLSEPWNVGKAWTIWAGSFTLEAYYVSLDDCALCMKAIMWGGSSPYLKAGLAFCTLSMVGPLVSYPFQIVPTQRRSFYAGYQHNNQRVHCISQTFTRRIHQDDTSTSPVPPPPPPG